MGLDISAYSYLELVEHRQAEGFEDGYCTVETHVQTYNEGPFPFSFAGLVETGEGQCYAFTERTEVHSFRAGSYGGYGAFRDELAGMFNLDPRENYWHDGDPDLPFFELINMSDCEGSIGRKAATNLLADFREHRERFLHQSTIDTDGYRYFGQKYDDWTRACELASHDGLIAFH